MILGPVLRFYPENSVAYKGLNSKIAIARFRSVIIENLNLEVLYPQVYANLKYLPIEGSIGKVDANLFKEMRNLNYPYFNITNLRGFFHKNGIEWMQNMDYYIQPFEPTVVNGKLSNETLRMLQYNLIMLEIGNHINNDMYPISYFPFYEYSFPEEDFCLYAK